MASVPTVEELKKLRVVDLKEKLSKLGKSTSGLKADLIERLHTVLLEQAAEEEEEVEYDQQCGNSIVDDKAPVVEVVIDTSQFEVMGQEHDPYVQVEVEIPSYAGGNVVEMENSDVVNADQQLQQHGYNVEYQPSTVEVQMQQINLQQPLMFLDMQQMEHHHQVAAAHSPMMKHALATSPVVVQQQHQMMPMSVADHHQHSPITVVVSSPASHHSSPVAHHSPMFVQSPMSDQQLPMVVPMPPQIQRTPMIIQQQQQPAMSSDLVVTAAHGQLYVSPPLHMERHGQVMSPPMASHQHQPVYGSPRLCEHSPLLGQPVAAEQRSPLVSPGDAIVQHEVAMYGATTTTTAAVMGSPQQQQMLGSPVPAVSEQHSPIMMTLSASPACHQTSHLFSPQLGSAMSPSSGVFISLPQQQSPVEHQQPQQTLMMMSSPLSTHLSPKAVVPSAAVEDRPIMADVQRSPLDMEHATLLTALHQHQDMPADEIVGPLMTGHPTKDGYQRQAELDLRSQPLASQAGLQRRTPSPHVGSPPPSAGQRQATPSPKMSSPPPPLSGLRQVNPSLNMGSPPFASLRQATPPPSMTVTPPFQLHSPPPSVTATPPQPMPAYQPDSPFLVSPPSFPKTSPMDGLSPPPARSPTDRPRPMTPVVSPPVTLRPRWEQQQPLFASSGSSPALVAAESSPMAVEASPPMTRAGFGPLAASTVPHYEARMPALQMTPTSHADSGMDSPSGERPCPPLMSLDVEKPAEETVDDDDAQQLLLPDALEKALAFKSELANKLGVDPDTIVTMPVEAREQPRMVPPPTISESVEMTDVTIRPAKPQEPKPSKNKRRKLKKKKRARHRRDEQENALNRSLVTNGETGETEPDVEIQYIQESFDLNPTDPLYQHFMKIFEAFKLTDPEAEKREAEEAAVRAKAEAKKEPDLRKKPKDADEEPEEDMRKEETPKLSKRKMKKLNQLSVAELKQHVNRPDVVEMHDITAKDPKLLVLLKSTRNTVSVPRHWCFKRKYLQGKRGIEKPPFDLPDFIKKTGIMEMRQALQEKEDQKTMKAKMRERVRPKLGKIDIDYQKLHDAFFKWQTKPRMTIHGDLYYEGKELETRLREKKPGDLTNELRSALGMPTGPNAHKVPPPWLIAMQRYGPPPSYPNLKIPGLNSPIPENCSFGYHAGGWGKPPVDEMGKPLYGDVFGTSGGAFQQTMLEEEVDRTMWGELESESESESEEEDEDEEEEEEDAMDKEDVDRSGMATPSDPGLVTPSGLSSIPTGMETPDMIELRKRKIETEMEGGETPALYTILPEKKAERIGGAMMGSTHIYDISAAMPGRVRPPGLGGAMDGGVEVALDPSELDMDSAAMAARYEQTLREQQNQLEKEDLSDMVAEHSAKQKSKRKRAAGQQDSGRASKKYKDFKF